MEWINIEDRRPKIGEAALVVRVSAIQKSSYVDILRFEGAHWRDGATGPKVLLSQVAYWTPLPKPPKNDTDLIYAVDFDGTLCVDRYPEIGEPRPGVIEFIKAEQARGAKLILWTCRGGEQLEAAVTWCKEQGIKFDTVNENLPEHIALYNNDCRKVYADRYIDDRNIIVDIEGTLILKGSIAAATQGGTHE